MKLASNILMVVCLAASVYLSLTGRDMLLAIYGICLAVFFQAFSIQETLDKKEE